MFEITEILAIVSTYANCLAVVSLYDLYLITGLSFRPPVVCEETEDSYLFLKTDSAHVRYSLDSPGR